MNLTEVILQVLAKNQWGLFHKSDPLEKLKVHDSPNVYRINEVSITDFISEFNEIMEDMNRKESLENKEK